MCDTFVALGNSTADGAVIFGKNSDREPNEAHEICIIPAADHAEGTMVNCTYVSVPQVAHTYAVLLAKPFWIWGAEMGMNEHGVTIGNEAIFTKLPYEKEKGLIGMDFIRLALERSRTAYEALHTITQLLEAYGQGGSCGFTHPFYYHNSFILADPQDAWVLETAGRHWVAEKVKDVRSISNAATIGSEWDLASEDLVREAVARKWCKGRDDFHFARCYSDVLYTTLSDSSRRYACTTQLLQARRGMITLQYAFETLRSHGLGAVSTPRLDRAVTGATVCMHAGAGPVRNSQSTGSMVAHLAPNLHTAWMTGTSAPCTGIFKPVWLDSGLPLDEPSPTGKFDERCLWWRHERLHSEVLKDFSNRLPVFSANRDALEASFLADWQTCGADEETRRDFSRSCFERAERALTTWIEDVRSTPIRRAPRFYYSAAWRNFNRQAAME